jgi:hypothetical protein
MAKDFNFAPPELTIIIILGNYQKVWGKGRKGKDTPQSHREHRVTPRKFLMLWRETPKHQASL